jgi:hypothetical protein
MIHGLGIERWPAIDREKKPRLPASRERVPLRASNAVELSDRVDDKKL